VVIVVFREDAMYLDEDGSTVRLLPAPFDYQVTNIVVRGFSWDAKAERVGGAEHPQTAVITPDPEELAMLIRLLTERLCQVQKAIEGEEEESDE
jgi:hypothetical protein